jgi:hypothetical protein
MHLFIKCYHFESVAISSIQRSSVLLRGTIIIMNASASKYVLLYTNDQLKLHIEEDCYFLLLQTLSKLFLVRIVSG